VHASISIVVCVRYDAGSAEIDTFCVNNPLALFIVAAGNGGALCSNAYSKNAITVGSAAIGVC
jgi:hypothetical protein